MKTKAYTAEETRERFLRALKANVDYWATVPLDRNRDTVRERIDGAVFSILNLFDGTTIGLPAMDIVLRPHEDDKAFCQNRGERWFEDGMVINDTMLHEEYVGIDGR